MYIIYPGTCQNCWQEGESDSAEINTGERWTQWTGNKRNCSGLVNRETFDIQENS